MEQEQFNFLPLRVIRVGPSGRRSYDPEGKRKLIAACRQPGASISKMARRAEVNVKQLHNWLAQDIGRSLRPASNSAFVPVLEMEHGELGIRSAATNNRSDARLNATNSSPIRLIAQLRNGVSFELHCAATDRDLLMATISSLGAG